MSDIEYLNNSAVENGFFAGFRKSAAEIGRNQRFSLHDALSSIVFFDFGALLVGYAAPHLSWLEWSPRRLDVENIESLTAVLAVLLFYLTTKTFHAYKLNYPLQWRPSASRIALCLAATFSAMALISFAAKWQGELSRLWFFLWLLLCLVASTAYRVWLARRLQARIARGHYAYKALSVSAFHKPLEAREILAGSGNVVSIVKSLRFDNIGELATLSDHFAAEEVDQIYISCRWVDAPVVLEAVKFLRLMAAEVFVVPDDRRLHAYLMDVNRFGSRLSMTAVARPIDAWGLRYKRAQDVVLSSLLLLLSSPVWLAVAIAIRLDSNGPILFRQTRVGFNGRKFELYKFRSMRAAASDAHARVQTSRADNRVTRVGRFIRRTSLDELPQLLNVLQGTMSLVGPRPHALQTSAEGRPVADLAESYAARHRVKPGITGWAQVNGYRGELTNATQVQARVDYDIEYIDNWSTWLDLKIVLRTAWLLVHDPAAY